MTSEGASSLPAIVHGAIKQGLEDKRDDDENPDPKQPTNPKQQQAPKLDGLPAVKFKEPSSTNDSHANLPRRQSQSQYPSHRRGQTPSGIPRQLDYGFPRSMSTSSYGQSGDAEGREEDGDVLGDPERINFVRVNSDFRGGFDSTDIEQRMKVSSPYYIIDCFLI